MKIKPRHNWVLCTRLQLPTPKTTGGIVMPESMKSPFLVGRVEEVGKGADNGRGKLLKTDLLPGDVVVIPIGAHTQVITNPHDPDWFMVQDEDIAGTTKDWKDTTIIVPQDPKLVVLS